VKKLEAWRTSFHDIGVRRCGVATGFAPDGSEVVAAIALDAVADLGPLPMRVRSGAWLSVEAAVIVPATSAHVVIMGPSGEPQPIPSSFDGSRVHARFSADRPGPFTVQVVADVATGPRPVLEAELFADVEPPLATPNLAAPGEVAGVGVSDKARALATMVDTMRVAEKRKPLTRDSRLDAVALAHARRMLQAHTLGHDVGDGDPAERLANAGIRAKETGENVAHAQSVVLAHRALYASVSHRENLLSTEFTHFGVAVIEENTASVWVAEVFSTPLQ
jgi:Cysteine-rich secretory protein family